MLRTVANMWDYPGVENEAAFDPLVALLINASAAELAKINRSKKLSQSRLTQEVARLLIPDANTRAVPSHAVASAKPLEKTELITEKEEFLVLDRQPEGEGVERYFSPTATFPVADVEVKFQASSNNISKIIDHKYKNVLGYTSSNQVLPPATLYLGLEVNEELNTVDELTFFFNLLNDDRKEFFLQQLKSSTWSLADEILEKKSGYPSTVPMQEDLEAIFTKRYQINEKACREVNQFYEQQFLTLQNISGLLDADRETPQALTNAFDPEVLGEVDNNLLWLKVEFPHVVSDDLLDDLFCFSNCFPVLNRQSHDFMFRLQDNLNIIPLKTNDYFFDIQRIVDSGNKPYHVYGDKENQATEDNSVLLRTSGVGRFGAFEAQEELHYLLETLKDETASYAAIGTETIEGIVSEINVLMGDLEEKVDGMETSESVSYLAMRNLKNVESLFVDFWTTAGAQANNISAGSALEVMGQSNIEPKGSVFITPTVGGKNRLSESEKLTSFKRSLLANDRLVTKEDVKSYCKEQLGNRTQKIEVKKGLATGMERNKGLIRTIDIELSSNSSVQTSKQEWNFLIDDLLTKIKSRVAHTFPYRILLDGTVKKQMTDQQ
jgi:hypothetical protein